MSKDCPRIAEIIEQTVYQVALSLYLKVLKSQPSASRLSKPETLAEFID